MMIRSKILLCNELNGISRAASWLSSLRSLLVPSLPSKSLDILENPPPKGPLTLRNAYIPVNRAFLFRELIQDNSVIVPSDRDNFEQIVLSLQKRFAVQFRLLEREMLLLFQPVLYESPEHLDHNTHFVSSNTGVSTLRLLTDSEKRDREFWILRRLSQLADAAGFIQVPQNHLEHAFHAEQFSREVASIFVNPKDYDVIRFWIRGIHPRTVKPISPVAAPRSSGGLMHLIGKYILRPSFQFPYTLQRLTRGPFKLMRLTSDSSSRVNKNMSSPDLCFANVLMAVRTVNGKELLLKLYDSAPATKPSRRSDYTDRLALLMPMVHFRPLTPTGRVLVAASCLTAFTCLGLVAPFAWLVTSNAELVFAWSMAASTTAGLTACLVWARYWRSREKISAELRNLQFNFLRNSGFQSVQNLIQIAVDEELKAAVLAYALLLQPTEAGSPLSPIGLGIRAETWIAKRLTPKAHVPLPSVSQNPEFTGGSGPLFDVIFDPERPLELLRRLGLVRGPRDSPQAVPTATAMAALSSESGTERELSSVWVLDPILGEDFKKNTLV